MRAAFEVAEGVDDAFEREGAVDHRSDPVRLDGADHVELVTTRADRYALEAQPLGLSDGERDIIDSKPPVASIRAITDSSNSRTFS